MYYELQIQCFIIQLFGKCSVLGIQPRVRDGHVGFRAGVPTSTSRVTFFPIPTIFGNHFLPNNPILVPD